MAGADEIRWARRVKPERILLLYTLHARGVAGEDLIDEVGSAMYARCESIRAATRAHAGRATCPRCQAQIPHEWRRDQVLECPCGWRATWGEYFKSYQGKQLHGGQAYSMFRVFLDTWPACRTRADRMLAIDALIHASHGEFKGQPGRPAACNLIEGTAKELVRFLDALAYGNESLDALIETRDRWRQGVETSRFLKWLRDG